MELRSLISNLAVFGLATAFVSGCGDNPIETENARPFAFAGVEDSLSRMERALDSLGYFGCLTEMEGVEQVEERCKAAAEVVASDTSSRSESIQEVIDRIVEIALDTTNFDDSGAFVASSSSTPDEPGSSSSGQVRAEYLEAPRQLNITLLGYKQKVDSLRKDKATGSVFVRFEVATFAKGDTTGFAPVTGLYLDSYKKKSWSGMVSSGFSIPEGVDSVSVCPVVFDQVEETDGFKNNFLMQGVCLGIGKVGQVDESVHTEKNSNKKVQLDWSWNLFETDL